MNGKRCEYCGSPMLTTKKGNLAHYWPAVPCLRIRAMLMTIAGFNTPESRAALKHFETEFARSAMKS